MNYGRQTDGALKMVKERIEHPFYATVREGHDAITLIEARLEDWCYIIEAGDDLAEATAQLLVELAAGELTRAAVSAAMGALTAYRLASDKQYNDVEPMLPDGS